MQHVSRADFRRLPVHVTMRLHSDVGSLRDPHVVGEIERTFARGSARPGFRLVHYSFRDDHAHLIVEAADPAALGRGMIAIGTRLSRAFNRVTGRSGPVIAERYRHRLLATPKDVRDALRHVLLGAPRRAKKIGERGSPVGRLDPASSARWFDGWKDPALTRATMDVGPDAPRPVARPRTWLLNVGWRRYGLLDPTDVPE